ncbi:MAG: hypothetical protein WCD52_23985 [Xanthobacteraceae bacterium]
MIGHAIRAVLLASAMAATFVGRRANDAGSQGLCLVPWIFGVSDDGKRAGREQAAQIAIALASVASFLCRFT